MPPIVQATGCRSNPVAEGRAGALQGKSLEQRDDQLPSDIDAPLEAADVS